MEKDFNIMPHTTADKYFEIIGPLSYAGGMVLRIDYDDVDHKLVDREAQRLADILNRHWRDDEK